MREILKAPEITFFNFPEKDLKKMFKDVSFVLDGKTQKEIDALYKEVFGASSRENEEIMEAKRPDHVLPIDIFHIDLNNGEQYEVWTDGNRLYTIINGIKKEFKTPTQLEHEIYSEEHADWAPYVIWNPMVLRYVISKNGAYLANCATRKEADEALAKMLAPKRPDDIPADHISHIVLGNGEVKEIWFKRDCWYTRIDEDIKRFNSLTNLEYAITKGEGKFQPYVTWNGYHYFISIPGSSCSSNYYTRKEADEALVKLIASRVKRPDNIPADHIFRVSFVNGNEHEVWYGPGKYHAILNGEILSSDWITEITKKLEGGTAFTNCVIYDNRSCRYAILNSNYYIDSFETRKEADEKLKEFFAPKTEVKPSAAPSAVTTYYRNGYVPSHIPAEHISTIYFNGRPQNIWYEDQDENEKLHTVIGGKICSYDSAEALETSVAPKEQFAPYVVPFSGRALRALIPDAMSGVVQYQIRQQYGYRGIFESRALADQALIGPVQNIETVQKETKMAKKNVVATIKSDMSAAAVRVASKKAVQAVGAGVVKGMKAINPKYEVVTKALVSSEAGQGLMALLVGVVGPLIPTVGEDSRVKLLSEECRVAGMAGVGNSVVDTVVEYAGPLLGVLNEAVESIPEAVAVAAEEEAAGGERKAMRVGG